mgnify:CR=1 FL=1
MFTGIVEETGKIRSAQTGGTSGRLDIEADMVIEGTKIGDSIAVNGVCLTVVELGTDGFTADVMPETAERSSLGKCRPGDKVNLERAMAADGRFGGHIVSGHIDGTGRIESLEDDGIAVWVSIRAEKALLKYIVEKGSVAIDGISLTVAYVDGDRFKVSVIPHTGEATMLLEKKPGDTVNLENDIIGKYVDKLMHFRDETGEESEITMDFLIENGF